MVKFADGSGSRVVAKLSELPEAINMEMRAQTEWCAKANMVIEPSKTEVLPVKVKLAPIVAESMAIEPVSSVRFLGVHIQSNGGYMISLSERRERI